MTAQGKTEGRHPGSSLSPYFTTLKGSHKKTLDIFFAAPTGRNDFWGDRKPRVADFVLTLGCHVLPFQGVPQPRKIPSSYHLPYLITKVLAFDIPVKASQQGFDE